MKRAYRIFYPKNHISYSAIAKVGRVKIRNTDPTSTSFLFSASRLLSALANNVCISVIPNASSSRSIARQLEHNLKQPSELVRDIAETELSIGACAFVRHAAFSSALLQRPVFPSDTPCSLRAPSVVIWPHVDLVPRFSPSSNYGLIDVTTFPSPCT